MAVAGWGPMAGLPVWAQANAATNHPYASKTKLSRAEAIEIANKLARERGIKLEAYKAPVARFDPEKSRWWLLYDHQPPGYPGGHFGISVSDETRATQFFGGR